MRPWLRAHEHLYPIISESYQNDEGNYTLLGTRVDQRWCHSVE